MEILLSNDVLNAISNAVQLVQIARLDSQYETDKQSAYGCPVKFHQAMLEEIQRHTAVVERLLEEHHVPETWSPDYMTYVEKQETKEVLALISSKWPDNRKEITDSWAYDLAAAIRVYGIVVESLKDTRLSDRCLQLLSLVTVSCAGVPAVKPQSLRRGIERLRDKLGRRK